jgi:hypothetical protein
VSPDCPRLLRIETALRGTAPHAAKLLALVSEFNSCWATL